MKYLIIFCKLEFLTRNMYINYIILITFICVQAMFQHAIYRIMIKVVKQNFSMHGIMIEAILIIVMNYLSQKKAKFYITYEL